MPFNKQSFKRYLTVQESAKVIEMFEAGSSQREDDAQLGFSHSVFQRL